jgi:hypothetical protein
MIVGDDLQGCLAGPMPRRGFRSRIVGIVMRASLPRTRRRLNAATFGLLTCGLGGVLLAGCGVSTDGVGTLAIDPAYYSELHCKDMVNRWVGLHNREKELRDLMNKANESGGGVVIGAISYRTDYELTLSREKLLQRTAAEKKCELEKPAQSFQSDQSIR